MSNENMANQVTDVPSAIAELLALNKQLKQQLEEMTNKCAEINFDKNCLISDLREMGKDLFHLRDHNKKLADQNREIKQQLESLKHDYREKLGYLSLNKARQFLAKYRGENE